MPLSTQSEALLTAFAGRPGVTAEHVANLRATLDASPVLVDQVNGAVAAGYLRHFDVLPPTANAGGTYDGASKTMNLPLSMLAPATYDRGEATFVLGHELQHGFNHATTTQAYTTFNADVRAIAQSPNATHDYTTPATALLAANRNDEARAQIAGYNAIVSGVRATNPDATLRDIYNAAPGRMTSFIARDATTTPPTYAMREGLTVDANLAMTASPLNIEGQGRHYFDQPGSVSRLGHHGDSDYANYYGAYIASVVSQNERAFAQVVNGVAPQLTLDMSRLRINEASVERNGVDLGSNQAPVPYFDSSTQPSTAHHFNHTSTTHVHVPIRVVGVDGTPARSEPGQPPVQPHAHPTSGTSDPRNLANPLNPIYQQIEAGVHRLDELVGRTSDASSEAMTASLFALARERDFRRVDHVLLSIESGQTRAGQNVFIVQGDLSHPGKLRAHMATADAIAQPVEASLARVAALPQPGQDQQVELEQIQQRGPGLSR